MPREFADDVVDTEQTTTKNAFEEFSIDDPIDGVELEDQLEEAVDNEDDVLEFENEETIDPELASDEEGFEDEDEDSVEDEDLAVAPVVNTELEALRAQNEEFLLRLNTLEQKKVEENFDTQLTTVETQIRAVNTKLKEALDGGDAEQIADAQTEMAELVVDRSQLKREKVSAAKKVRQTSGSSSNLKPLARKYVGLNPWIDDPQKAPQRDVMFAIDRAVAAEGMSDNDESYYLEIAKRVNAVYPGLFNTGGKKLMRAKKAKGSNRAQSALNRPAGKSSKRVRAKGGKELQFTKAMAINMRKFGLDPHDKDSRNAYLLEKKISDAREKKDAARYGS